MMPWAFSVDALRVPAKHGAEKAKQRIIRFCLLKEKTPRVGEKNCSRFVDKNKLSRRKTAYLYSLCTRTCLFLNSDWHSSPAPETAALFSQEVSHTVDGGFFDTKDLTHRKDSMM
jgi:hypothetical protein